MWGGGRQLFCRAQRGGFVTLGFSNRRAGRYRLRVLATAAPDFGVVRVALDGNHRGPAINLYSGRVSPAGSIDLGAIDLTAGRHALRFTSVGKDPASANVWFGVDAIELAAAESASPPRKAGQARFSKSDLSRFRFPPMSENSR